MFARAIRYSGCESNLIVRFSFLLAGNSSLAIVTVPIKLFSFLLERKERKIKKNDCVLSLMRRRECKNGTNGLSCMY